MTSPDEARKRFNKLVIESFLESMAFGDVVLHFLELTSPFNRDEIAEKPKLFSKELESLFGDGAKIIETTMIRNLYRKLGIKHAKIGRLTFPEQIKKAWKEYLGSEKLRKHMQ